jgi:cation diffusion facilitator family transporter
MSNDHDHDHDAHDHGTDHVHEDHGHEDHGHEDHAHPHEPHAHPHEDHAHPHDAHGHDAHGHDEHGHDHEGHDHDGHGHDHPGGLWGFVRSIFAPHSHDAADSVDSALESSRDGMRALKISLIGLAVTAVLQVVIVLISGSVALLADTVHNFADALTAVPLAIAFWLGRRPPNKRYTYGYGRAEDLAGIFILAMIALSAVVAAWEAVDRLVNPSEVKNVGWVIAAGVIGFIGNELVAVYRIRVGRRIGSAALVADGLHARTDGVTSLGVVLGGLGVAAGWDAADPVVGLLITVAILFVLKGAARDIYHRLMDSVDPGLVDSVEAVLAGVPGIQAVERVRIRWIGHELRAEAEVVSDSRLTVAESHGIAEEAHHLLLHRIPKLSGAIIHTNPCNHDGLDHHLVTEHHFARP